ncbi:MAG: tryptophan synthase subunit beta [Bacteroidetes bacterium GWF2_49_14]|nr:MAG: tryptophan synthase subunit beta [Bacteroidetes bacterium GWF2_49_14]HBB90293.1 tryptophan synthase subunit beta [Bacteroidales bacterium]
MVKSRFTPDERGYYGEFGGAFIPEMLMGNIQELQERYLEIVESEMFKSEFHSLLRDYSGRPTPLYPAMRLSEKYKTHVFLKREDLNHTGAHKINNCVGQVLLAEKLGKKRIIAETGAGQHGVATATVCALKGLECVVYMGALDVERQAPNVTKMKMLGATVVPVHSGNKTLKDATNEAMRDWISHPSDTHYIIGSVVGPHPYPDLVARLQSVISYEVAFQLDEKTGKPDPDVVIACVGGGSNAAGGFYAFLDNPDVKLIGAEAAGLGNETGESAATLALGRTGILHGSKSYLIQDIYGQVTEPYSISAGLDYPGIGPLHSHLYTTGRCRYLSITDQEALEAAMELTRMEGIIPALESAHAMAVLRKESFRPDENVVIILSGRGDKDMSTYSNYFKNEPDR